MRQEVRNEAQLIQAELGGMAGAWARKQGGRTFTAGGRHPLADGPLGDIEDDGDVPLLPAELLEARLASDAIPASLEDQTVQRPCPIIRAKNFSSFRNAQ